MTDRAGAKSVNKGIAINVPVFNESYYHRADLLVRIEQIEKQDI